MFAFIGSGKPLFLANNGKRYVPGKLSDMASKYVKRNFNTKVYSKQPVSMAIEGQLFDSMSNEMLIKFNDKEMSESITFEEINRVTAGADMRQLMRRWSTKISQGLSSVAE